MVNGNSGVVGILAETIAPMRSKVFGVEGVLTDINVLGMTRPLSQLKLAETLAEGGGILSSLQTGVKKMTAARKDGQTGGSQGGQPKRYRPPTQPPAPGTGQAVDQPATLEIIL